MSAENSPMLTLFDLLSLFPFKRIYNTTTTTTRQIKENLRFILIAPEHYLFPLYPQHYFVDGATLFTFGKKATLCQPQWISLLSWQPFLQLVHTGTFPSFFFLFPLLPFSQCTNEKKPPFHLILFYVHHTNVYYFPSNFPASGKLSRRSIERYSVSNLQISFISAAWLIGAAFISLVNKKRTPNILVVCHIQGVFIERFYYTIYCE